MARWRGDRVSASGPTPSCRTGPTRSRWLLGEPVEPTGASVPTSIGIAAFVILRAWLGFEQPSLAMPHLQLSWAR